MKRLRLVAFWLSVVACLFHAYLAWVFAIVGRSPYTELALAFAQLTFCVVVASQERQERQ